MINDGYSEEWPIKVREMNYLMVVYVLAMAKENNDGWSVACEKGD